MFNGRGLNKALTINAQQIRGMSVLRDAFKNVLADFDR